MQTLIKQNNTVEWNGNQYELGSVTPIDSMNVHVELSGEIICFVGGDTTVNGVLCNNSDDINNALQ